MTESSDWQAVHRALSPFGRLIRVENPACLGTPDVWARLRGVGMWLELKHLDALPARVETKVRLPKLTIEQVLWLEAEQAAGGRAWLLLHAGADWFLCAPDVARGLYEARYTAEELGAACTEHARGAGAVRGLLARLTG